jgi:hypothetical protein
VHVHYLGAGALSFGENIRLHNGDAIEISFEGFGRPLRNIVLSDSSTGNRPVRVHPLN